jgi:hypothetical protein
MSRHLLGRFEHVKEVTMAALRRKKAFFVKRVRKWRNGKADYAKWGAAYTPTPKRVNGTRWK